MYGDTCRIRDAAVAEFCYRFYRPFKHRITFDTADKINRHYGGYSARLRLLQITLALVCFQCLFILHILCQENQLVNLLWLKKRSIWRIYVSRSAEQPLGCTASRTYAKVFLG